MIIRRRFKVESSSQEMSIAQELVDAVMDYLEDDTKNMKMCSLVCSSMLHRCTKHLFKRVSVTTTRLCDCIETLRTSPRMRHSIMQFTIVGDNSIYIMPVHVHLILQLLPRLAVLHFTGEFRCFATKPALPLPIAKRAINTVRFDSIHLDLIECVLEMLHAAKLVELRGEYVEGSVNAPRTAGRARALQFIAQPRWLDTILKLFAPSYLTNAGLSFQDTSVVDPHELGGFMQVYGPHLRYLTFQLPVAGLAQALPTPILEPCIRLESLALSSPRTNTASVHRILRTSSTGLRALRLSIHEESVWGDGDWKKLRHDLVEHANLEELVLERMKGSVRSAFSTGVQPGIRNLLSPRLNSIVRFYPATA